MDILSELYNNCDPAAPAARLQYVDCANSRGGYGFVDKCLKELERSRHHLRFLFSGHIGSGKSSELVQLRSRLESGQRFFPILMDAGDYLDDYDVTTIDILLAIVAEVANQFRHRLEIELADTFFKRRIDEVAEYFMSEAELGDLEVGLGVVKTKLVRLKKSPEARKQVREKLLPQMTSILTEVNSIFAQARTKLGSKTFEDVVLILDNLEKVRRFAGEKEGEASQQHLFIHGAGQLTDLKVHLILTVPLSLVRARGNQLASLYSTPYVLPMVKVEQKGTHEHYQPGAEQLREVLQKRLVSSPLDDAITPEAAQWMIRYSGGDIRALMRYVREATNFVDEGPITIQAARQALRQTIANFSGLVPAAHWPKMAALERSRNQTIDNNDADFRAMLEQLTILEYINGGDETDPFSDAAPWYAVHPVVRELSQFKTALEEYDLENGGH